MISSVLAWTWVVSISSQSSSLSSLSAIEGTKWGSMIKSLNVVILTGLSITRD